MMWLSNAPLGLILIVFILVGLSVLVQGAVESIAVGFIVLIGLVCGVFIIIWLFREVESRYILLFCLTITVLFGGGYVIQYTRETPALLEQCMHDIIGNTYSDFVFESDGYSKTQFHELLSNDESLSTYLIIIDDHNLQEKVVRERWRRMYHDEIEVISNNAYTYKLRRSLIGGRVLIRYNGKKCRVNLDENNHVRGIDITN